MKEAKLNNYTKKEIYSRIQKLFGHKDAMY